MLVYTKRLEDSIVSCCIIKGYVKLGEKLTKIRANAPRLSDDLLEIVKLIGRLHPSLLPTQPLSLLGQ